LHKKFGQQEAEAEGEDKVRQTAIGVFGFTVSIESLSNFVDGGRADQQGRSSPGT
jgi:hypothetical protein